MKKVRFILLFAGLMAYSAQGQTAEEAINLMDNEGGIGVKAHAMGNAFSPVADDYSAVYWNPAGLTQITATQVYGNLSHLQFNNEARYSNSTLADSRNFTKLQSIGLAIPLPTSRGSFVLAFGYNRVKDYDDYLLFDGYSNRSNNLSFELSDDNGFYADHPFDNNVQRTEQISQEGSLGTWSFGGGVQMSRNFSVGLTLNIFSGGSDYLFDFLQQDVNNLYTAYPANYTSYELHQKLITDISGWNLKAGGLFRLNEMLRLGMTIEFPTVLSIREQYSSDDVLTFDDGYVSEFDLGSGEWEYEVSYPFKFGAGLALTLKQFQLAASVDYRDWSQVQFEIPDGLSLDEDFSALLDENSLISGNFRPVVNYSIGGELRIADSGVKLRAGYRYLPSPLRDAGSELDRQYYSAGIGYDIDNSTTLEFSSSRGTWQRSSLDSYTPGGTTESITTDRVLVGLTFRL
jgi:long-subunit fatty acid transport protein